MKEDEEEDDDEEEEEEEEEDEGEKEGSMMIIELLSARFIVQKHDYGWTDQRTNQHMDGRI